VQQAAQQYSQNNGVAPASSAAASSATAGSTSSSSSASSTTASSYADAAFPYPSQLEQIRAMGFTDDEGRIKAVLVANRGNLTRTVNNLLSSINRV